MEKPSANVCSDFAQVIALVAESLFTTFTGKYVVELALGKSSRIRLAVICLLLIIGEQITKYITHEIYDYGGYYGDYKFACHMTRKLYARICPQTMKTMKAVKIAMPYKRRGQALIIYHIRL